MLHSGSNKTTAPIQTRLQHMILFSLWRSERPSSHLDPSWFPPLARSEHTFSSTYWRDTVKSVKQTSLLKQFPRLPVVDELQVCVSRHCLNSSMLSQTAAPFFLVPVSINLSPNSASPFLLGHLPPTPTNTVQQKCFIVYLYKTTKWHVSPWHSLFIGFVDVCLEDPNNRKGFWARLLPP